MCSFYWERKEKNNLSFYLIPETLKKTNLAKLNVNDFINFEIDTMAKAIHRYQENQIEHNT